MSTLHILFEIVVFFFCLTIGIRIFYKLSRMRGRLKFTVPISLWDHTSESELLTEYVAGCRVHCVQEIMAQSIN